MELIIGGVLVALVGGGGPLMWVLTRFDKRNTMQHDKSMEVLSRVETKVDRLDEKVGHLDTKVYHVDSKIIHVDVKVADIHDRVATLEKPKTARSKAKSV